MPTTTDATLELIVTDNGQITLPEAVRDALHLKSGDRLNCFVEGDRIVMRVPHPGAAALSGSMKSDKGKGMTFAEIREAALQNSLKDGYFDKYK